MNDTIISEECQKCKDYESKIRTLENKIVLLEELRFLTTKHDARLLKSLVKKGDIVE